MRYDELYAIMAERALSQAVVDIEAFVKQLLGLGVPAEAIRAQIEADLKEKGPLFGKFFKSLEGAIAGATKVAEIQAVGAGEIAATKPDLIVQGIRDAGDKHFTRESVTDLIEELKLSKPELLEAIENLAENEKYVWKAALINTCHRCLPLHNHSFTKAEWRQRGFHPSVMHAGWGPKSACDCTLLLDENADPVALEAPLKRNKDIQGIRGGKRTLRGVSQIDQEKAFVARDKALDSKEGRAILRRLGQSNA